MNIIITAQIVFWVSLALLALNYGGVALLLRLTASRRKEASTQSVSDADLPSVTVLIPAHNEESVIQQRLDNLLESDYPKDKLDVLVASDCSTDGTEYIVRQYLLRGVRLEVLTERHGKLGIIDRFAPQAPGDVIVITDANVTFELSALRRLCSRYVDPQVGGVCGVIEMVAPVGSHSISKEVSYRRYEFDIKRLTSAFGFVIGAFGGFYSFRKILFRSLGTKPCHDDIILPLEITAQGFQYLYADNAFAKEKTLPTLRGEYHRRLRMTAYNMNSFGRMLRLAFRSSLRVGLTALAYKALRWLSPYIWALLIISALIAISAGTVYKVVALVFCIALGLSLVGWRMDLKGRTAGVATSIYHFALMNWATFAGLTGWLKGPKRYWSERIG
jgi:cellulose synthase/poly-beta-1,6-N-acetylglucosamine synthase-like glycosyltransferase